MTTNYTYPFDPTGTAVSNLIVNENQALAAPDQDDFFFIVPNATPFFRESLVVKRLSDGMLLEEGKDYVCTHLFYAATHQTGRPVYGSISIYDRTMVGVSLEYQTVGGMWTLNNSDILSILARTQINPRITTWEQVTELPMQFPAIDHEFDIVDFTGARDVVDAIKTLENVIAASRGESAEYHIQNKDNPHETNAYHVGLGQVKNYPTATLEEARSGIADNRYMTPATTKEAIQALTGIGNGYDLLDMRNNLDGVIESLNEHTANKNNPHEVSKAQVGLDKVQNYPTASLEEAEIGTAEDRYMTPVMTRSAIELHIGNIDLAGKLDTVVFENFLDELIDIIRDNIVTN